MRAEDQINPKHRLLIRQALLLLYPQHSDAFNTLINPSELTEMQQAVDTPENLYNRIINRLLDKYQDLFVNKAKNELNVLEKIISGTRFEIKQLPEEAVDPFICFLHRFFNEVYEKVTETSKSAQTWPLQTTEWTLTLIKFNSIIQQIININQLIIDSGMPDNPMHLLISSRIEIIKEAFTLLHSLLTMDRPQNQQNLLSTFFEGYIKDSQFFKELSTDNTICFEKNDKEELLAHNSLNLYRYSGSRDLAIPHLSEARLTAINKLNELTQSITEPNAEVKELLFDLLSGIGRDASIKNSCIIGELCNFAITYLLTINDMRLVSRVLNLLHFSDKIVMLYQKDPETVINTKPYYNFTILFSVREGAYYFQKIYSLQSDSVRKVFSTLIIEKQRDISNTYTNDQHLQNLVPELKSFFTNCEFEEVKQYWDKPPEDIVSEFSQARIPDHDVKNDAVAIPTMAANSELLFKKPTEQKIEAACANKPESP